MQRPIEFRVWHNHEKCWEEVLTEGRLCINHGSPLFRLPLEVCKRRYPDYPNRPIDDYPFATLSNILGSPDFYTIQQFTGMLDKNGKKIFEGDIVKACVHVGYGDWDYRIGAVKYSCIDAQYEVCDADDVRTNNIGGHLICDGEEVIGNIFETPELLK